MGPDRRRTVVRLGVCLPARRFPWGPDYGGVERGTSLVVAEPVEVERVPPGPRESEAPRPGQADPGPTPALPRPEGDDTSRPSAVGVQTAPDADAVSLEAPGPTHSHPVVARPPVGEPLPYRFTRDRSQR